MAIRTVVTKEDERLRKQTRAVTDFGEKLWILLDDMYETMGELSGVGIAAPQVGILRKAVVVDVGEGKFEMMNPEIITEDGDQYGAEGCLSVPGEWGMVHRPQKVTVKYQDRTGAAQTLEAEGFLAVAVCHEIDHLKGVLFIDLADRMLDESELEETE